MITNAPELANDNRVAVYIDFDNVIYSRRNENKNDPNVTADVDLDAILDFASSYGRLATSRAYGDWSMPGITQYRERLLGRAVDTIQMFTTSGKIKNAADIRLSIDVIEDLTLLHGITHVVIVAGDSDYIPLAQRVKRMGRTVIGIGVAGSISRLLASACDEFYDYDELPGLHTSGDEDRNSADEETPPHDHGNPIQKNKQQETAAANKKPAKKQGNDNHQQDAEQSAAKSSDTTAPSSHDNTTHALISKSRATQLLLRALTYSASKTGEEWSNASEVKNQILRMEPAFQESALGFSTFTKFVESRQGQVEMRKNDTLIQLRLRDSRS